MTKPIGYYTSYTPGEESYLELLQEKYGAQFQEMTNREKLFLISTLASHLHCATPGETRSEIHALGEAIPEKLPVHDQEGLIEALIAQVRWCKAPER